MNKRINRKSPMDRGRKGDLYSQNRKFERSVSYSVDDIAKRTIYEDNHLLVINKPAGLATMGVSAVEDSLFTLAQQYIKIKYQKPGEVYLGVVSRLDLPVSGIVVFARTSKAAARLNEQFRNHTVQKIYHALVEGNLQPDEAELNDIICEDKVRRRLWIPDRFDARMDFYSPKEAKLRYKVLAKFTKTTLIEATLLTGRKHQIRLQFSHQGTPIVGDGKYGARPIVQQGICLHAFRLSLIHPTTKELKSFISSPPDWSFAE